MPTGKRASMREGPLAALFRKTSEEGEEEAAVPAEGEQAIAPESSAAPGASEASAAAPRGSEASAGSEPAPGGADGETAVPPRLTAAPEPGRRPFPHPSLEQPSPPEPRPVRHVPSPQERLRSVFSSDLPDNVLDRSTERPDAAPPAPVAAAPPVAPVPDPPVAEPVRDVYARPARMADSFAVPAPVGTPVLRVVGVGGAGVNAVNRMVEAEVAGVEFLAINTDLQSLQQSAADQTLHIGERITRGLGSGSDPEIGRQAAREEYDRIKAMLRGSDMVFIAAGAGGGTGTGAAPVVAQIARELGALTVGIVTRPFAFEGSRRREQAETGIADLAAEVDTLIVVPNNRLLSVLDRHTSMVEAFRVADDVLRQGVQGVSDLVTLPGLINLDFADVRTIMSSAGSALLGIGMGTGDRRAIEAAERAVASPLLETSMEGARSILLSITGSRDLSLWEVNEAAKAVAEAAHPEANIIFGAMVDDDLEDNVWVTVVATGFGDAPVRREQPGFGAARAGREGRLEPPRRTLREPAGEPRVSRVRQANPQREFDIPEFIPRR